MKSRRNRAKDMKKTNEVINEHPEFAKLIRSVGRNLNKENYIDVYNHGIDGGFGKFVYYQDTLKFWQNNRKDITALLLETAEMLGEDVLSMIRNFNCLGSDYTIDEIGRCLYGNYSEKNPDQVYNAFAWFAAEEVVRWYCED